MNIMKCWDDLHLFQTTPCCFCKVLWSSWLVPTQRQSWNTQGRSWADVNPCLHWNFSDSDGEWEATGSEPLGCVRRDRTVNIHPLVSPTPHGSHAPARQVTASLQPVRGFHWCFPGFLATAGTNTSKSWGRVSFHIQNGQKHLFWHRITQLQKQHSCWG